MKKITKVKRVYILGIIITIIILIIVRINTSHTEGKDINFAVNEYLTTGILNKYKLYDIQHSYLIFSDSNNAIINIMGIKNKTSTNTTCYKLKMSKDKSGIWHVKKVIPLSDVQFLNENH